jgi:hypothetical protein
MLLSLEQQQLCLEVPQDMLERANKDPDFLKTVITDKSWVYRYELETEVQSSQWKHPTSLRPPQKNTTGSEQCEGDTVFFPSITGVLCIMSVHHCAKLSIRVTTKKSFVIFMMQFGARDQSCGMRTTFSCIMTAPQLIHYT